MSGLYHRTAEQLRRTRQLREKVITAQVEGFGEPAFDMMIALFLAGDRAVAPAELAGEAYVEAGTAAIWLKWMVARGLVVDVAGDFALSERGDRLIVEFLDREAINRSADAQSIAAPR